jgi:4-hydroxy-3-methylbut-2-enyl diphosphate reductase
MEILQTKEIGFCFGVRRAIKIAEETISTLSHDDIYMLGEIIHNPQVINEFKKKGIHIVQNISQVPHHKYIITRAHGINKSEEQYSQQGNIKLIDTTCPYVKKLHYIANLLRKEKYQIIILGDIIHPEIKSLLSYIDNQAIVIQSLEDLQGKPYQFSKKIGILSQTTKDIEQYKQIIKEIFSYVEELRVFNTICKATLLRQQSAQELAKVVDLMIVIGGFNSANTTKLAYLSKKIGTETYHIENKSQLDQTWFRDKKKIGITTGTSTPDYVTSQVIKEIKRLTQNLR